MDDTERERLAMQVFSEICVLAEADRTAALDSRCATDQALRQRVAAMLQADVAPPESLTPKAVERFLQTEIGHVAGTTSADQPLPGDSLRNDYRLLRILGEGGMATVYEAEQQHPRRLVAIKIVRGGSFSAELRQRFEYEAQVLAKLQHPNIAQLYEADTQPDGASVCAYLAMELVRGMAIDEYVEKKFLNIRQRVQLLLRVCDAVEYAHRMGILHRDLKPANILVQEDGQPKILDFGVARAIDRDEKLATVLTSAGQVIGTLPYMSPEVVQGTGMADTRADVYALGVLLYKLLTGELPVNVSDCGIAEAARRICNDIPPAPSTHERTLRGDLDVIVGKALEKDAERRYRSVQSLAADLRRYLEGRAIEARGGSSLYVFRKAIWRYRQIAAIAGAFIGIIIAFAVYAAYQARKNHDLANQAAESRDSAVAARDAAAKNAEQLRHSLYLSNIGFAQAALETNDVGRVFPLLDGCPEDLRGWEWGYLRALSDRSERTWQTATRDPRAVDITPDHSRIALGGEGCAAVFDYATHETIYKRDFESGPTAVAISPDGRYLACGPRMDEMFLVDLTTKQDLWSPPPPTSRPAYSLLRRLRVLRFSPDGKTIASAGFDGHIRFRDTLSGELQHDINAKSLSVLCLAFTRDGQSIIGGDDSRHLGMWRISDGKILHEDRTHDGSIACVSFNDDQSLLASSASDGRVIIRKASDWSEVKTLNAGKTIVWSCAFSPDGKTVAAGSDDNLLRVWNLDSDAAPMILRGHADTVGFACFEPKAHTLTSVAADGMVKQWNMDRIEPFSVIPIEGAATFVTLFTPDNKRVLIACNDGSIRCWDRAMWKQIWKYEGPRTSPRGLSLDKQHGRLACSGDDNVVRLIDVADGHKLQELKIDAKEVQSVAFSADGNRMVTGDANGDLKQWNVETLPATLLRTIRSHDGTISSLAIAPDGVHIVTGGADGWVKLWSIDNEKPLATFHPNGLTVRDLQYDSAGKTLAVAKGDGVIFVLDGQTLRVTHELRGHQGSVNGLVFQPGTSRLASGGVDRTVRIWDVNSAAQILTLRGHRRPLEHLAFSPDGATLASSSLDGTVQLWDSRVAPSEMK